MGEIPVPLNLFDKFGEDRDAALLAFMIALHRQGRRSLVSTHRLSEMCNWPRIKVRRVLARLRDEHRFIVDQEVTPEGTLFTLRPIASEPLVKPKPLPKVPAKVAAKLPNEELEILRTSFNSLTGTNLKNIQPVEANFLYWRDIYQLEEILTALEIALKDPFWKEKITPTILLRRKSPDGQPIDRIGEFLLKDRRRHQPIPNPRQGDHPDGLYQM